VARNHAITDWAEAEMKRVRAAGFSDRPFTVMPTRAEPHLAQVDCPALLFNAEQDTGVFPSDASTDKTLTSIDTDHYFTTPGARSEQADTIARWIAKRWR
jgi:hypothetical protein